MSVTRIIVKRAAIGECQIVERPVPTLQDGEVRVRIDDFALTANNVTYAHVGETIGYWKFYPESEDWGVVPVWGFAEVIESRCEGLSVGARFWGFLPMASHAVMQPGRISPRGFIDEAAHRSALPAVYNSYALTNNDPPTLAAIADARSLMFPLLTTSWLIADYLADNTWFGAEQVVISSASSKTGYGTAHFVGKTGADVRVAGLTSPGNIDFVMSLGVCDTVLAYSDVASLDPAVPTAYVDMSGDRAVLSAIHHHFGDALVASIAVGMTHQDPVGSVGPLPGSRPAFFFAPSQIAKRDGEWGAGETMRRAGAANAAFIAQLGDRLSVIRHNGGAEIAEKWCEMVAGRTPPAQGLILNFADAVASAA
jgi:NADPH:quinone reductase-like Zn-dependent oxidoreductase